MPLINNANDIGIEVSADTAGIENANVGVEANGEQENISVSVYEQPSVGVTVDTFGKKSASVSVQPNSATLSADTNIGGAEPQYFRDHVLNMNNPHNTTAKQVGAVPLELGTFTRIAPADNTKSFREQAFIYVNKGNAGFRMSLQDIKNLNTKIVSANRVSDVDISELSADDYIFSEK